MKMMNFVHQVVWVFEAENILGGKLHFAVCTCGFSDLVGARMEKHVKESNIG